MKSLHGVVRLRHGHVLLQPDGPVPEVLLSYAARAHVPSMHAHARHVTQTLDGKESNTFTQREVCVQRHARALLGAIVMRQRDAQGGKHAPSECAVLATATGCPHCDQHVSESSTRSFFKLAPTYGKQPAHRRERLLCWQCERPQQAERLCATKHTHCEWQTRGAPPRQFPHVRPGRDLRCTGARAWCGGGGRATRTRAGGCWLR